MTLTRSGRSLAGLPGTLHAVLAYAPRNAPGPKVARPTDRAIPADEGYRVQADGDGRAALDLAISETPDLLLADLAMPALT
jgi:hypothetical protein